MTSCPEEGKRVETFVMMCGKAGGGGAVSKYFDVTKVLSLK